MGKTYNKRVYHGMKAPKGHKQAKVNGARKAPPTAWEDKPVAAAYPAHNAAKRMIVKGMDQQTIVKRLSRKFKISENEAWQTVEYAGFQVKEIAA